MEIYQDPSTTSYKRLLKQTVLASIVFHKYILPAIFLLNTVLWLVIPYKVQKCLMILLMKYRIIVFTV